MIEISARDARYLAIAARYMAHMCKAKGNQPACDRLNKLDSILLAKVHREQEARRVVRASRKVTVSAHRKRV